MAEITRQHLEDAALAAGGHLSPGNVMVLNGCTRDELEWSGPLGVVIGGIRSYPHLDDGDALRLAANVGMRITLPRHCGDGVSTETPDGKWSCTVYRDNKPAQMRVAIVLCAAEVGKRMREGGQ